MIFILAHDHAMAENWAKEAGLNPKSNFIVYVSGDPHRARRWNADSDALIRVGNFWERKDFPKIQMILRSIGFPTEI